MLLGSPGHWGSGLKESAVKSVLSELGFEPRVVELKLKRWKPHASHEEAGITQTRRLEALLRFCTARTISEKGRILNAPNRGSKSRKPSKIKLSRVLKLTCHGYHLRR